MPVNLVTCPSCNTTLKPKTPIPEGTRLKCPKCGSAFVVPGAPPPAPAPAPRPVAPRTAAAPRPRPAADEVLDATEIIDDDAGSAGPAPLKSKLKAVPLWVWLTGGGVALFLLCGCCGIGGWWAYASFLSGLAGGAGGDSAKVTKANYDKIKKDMSEAQVKTIMGEPSLSGEILGVKTVTWKNGDDFITIGFQKDKALSGAYQITNGPTKLTGGGPLP